MKQNRIIARLTALTLVFAIMLSFCVVGYAKDDSTLRIGSLKELQSFAERCSSNIYSNVLSVVLTQDIDLEETELSIPIFLGTFDGDGHKITGLKITSENSRTALFERIEAGAVVRNLQLEGNIVPSGSQNRIGGIAGENYGTIENCRFSGIVSGSEQVGGIAGLNEAGATVTGCSVSGVIRGKQFTGGIVGENAGSIIRCSNDASVNTTVKEEDISAAELAEIDSAIYDLLKKRDNDYKATVTTDTGGIAGHSTGVIQSCENIGTVGYNHVGYNVGGIVGRQSGYLSNCRNHGTVLGRKDVGGIVGQMAPDITLQVSTNSLDEIQKELNTLHSLIDQTLNDAESASNTFSEHLSQVSDYAETARNSTNEITNQLSSFADSNINSVNGLSLMIQRYISKFTPVMDDISAAAGGMTDTIGEARKLLEVLDGTTGYNEQFLLALREFCKETSQAAENMSKGLDALNNALELLKVDFTMPDTTQLKADIKSFQDAVAELEVTVKRALDELQNGGTVTEETARALADGLLKVLDCRMAVSRDLSDILKDADISALIDKTLETVKKFATEFQTALSYFSEASSHFSKAMNELSKGIDTLRNLNTKLNKAAEQLDTVLEAAEKASSSLQNATKKAAQWAKELSQEKPITFTPIGSEFTNSTETLNSALGGIGNEISRLNESVSSSSTVLLSDVRAINNQFMKVMNLFLNLIHETQNINYTDIVEDVSEENLQSAVQGKVQESENDGDISADRNVGGIVGAMAIEYDFDPEDDLLSDERSGKFTYQTRAILLNCKNSGIVTAKRSCAGSVVGRMDVGTVYGCGGFGDTTSDSGDYVGGVCGFSLSSIKESFAKCTISGRKYVGGIVGSGKRIEKCISMIKISSESSPQGAIAGEITEEYIKNYFVSDNLAGVDRISYAGKAEPIAYSKLLKTEGIPDEMKRFTLRFVADGDELKNLTFDYGDSFSADIVPEIPKKDGSYGVWSKTEFSKLHFDTTVIAEYIPYVTTIAGDDQRVDGRPVFFTEGEFDSNAAMSAEQYTVTSTELPEVEWWKTRDLLEGWKLTLPSDGSETHKLHYLAPDGDTDGVCILVKKDGKWEKTETTEFGSYIIAELDGTEVEIAVVREKTRWWLWFVPSGILLAVVSCFSMAAQD